MDGACSKTDNLYLAAFLSSCGPPYDFGLSDYLLERADGQAGNEAIMPQAGNGAGKTYHHSQYLNIYNSD